MVSSGTTPISTNGDAPIALLTAANINYFPDLYIINEGSAAGFFSLDNGTTWARLPSSFPIHVPNRSENTIEVLVKRIAGGTDLSGLYAWII